jgi:hypothetical protein
MRYGIRQMSLTGEVWLVRMTREGVWGSPERARGYFRRPVLERWLIRAQAPEGAMREIVVLTSPQKEAPPGEGTSIATAI